MMQGGLKRKNKASSEIPSSSLADMAFLLLIFFMVSTTFPKEKQRNVEFPEAEATKKLEDARKDILHIYMEEAGTIFINDVNTPPTQVSNVVAPMRAANPALIVVLRSDRDVPYQNVANVLTELQEASAVRVTFYTDLEQRITRRRR